MLSGWHIQDAIALHHINVQYIDCQQWPHTLPFQHTNQVVVKSVVLCALNVDFCTMLAIERYTSVVGVVTNTSHSPMIV